MSLTLAATHIPLIIPPPPTLTTITSKSGTCNVRQQKEMISYNGQ